MPTRFVACACLALVIGCANTRPGGVPDGGEADAAAPPDAEAPLLPGWHGEFCAAGQQIESQDGAGGKIVGWYCFGPQDIAFQPASKPGVTWEPGPIVVVSP